MQNFNKPVLLLLIAVLFCSGNSCLGQVGINLPGNAPNHSAGLDVDFTNKGFLMPRLTTSQRDGITSPAQALQIFNTTTNCFEVYLGTSWQPATCLCSAAPVTPGIINSSTSGCSATYSIATVSNATSYTWTVPSGATITAGQGTTSIVVNLGVASGTASVTANNACGSSGLSALTINSNNSLPGAVGTITGLTAVCISESGVNYQVPAVSGATSYVWTVPAGASIPSQTITNSVNVNYGNSAISGNVGVTAYNGCGQSSASLPVTVSTVIPGTPGVVSGPTTPLPGSTGNAYSISPVTNAVFYVWNVPSGSTIPSGQGSTSINMTKGTVGGNVCVTANTGCGASNSSCLGIDSTVFNTNGTTADNGSVQTWPVPSGVSVVNITAYGAKGGSVTFNGGNNGGGSGAMKMGTFSVNPGDGISIMVGKQGASASTNSGAGGGSFVWLTSSNTLLIAAAGGGGMGDIFSGGGSGSADSITTPGYDNGCAAGGTNGGGGSGGGNGTTGSGGGGGGWTGDGANGTVSAAGSGGKAALNGGAGGAAGGGGAVGGYGGGGGSGGNSGAGGGGGGYNGGGGGNAYNNNNGWGTGGGGGSYINPVATNASALAGGNPNPAGQVIITW